MFSPRLSKLLIIRRVVGDSMQPTLRPGQIVVASSLKRPTAGRIVVARLRGGREVIKRMIESTDVDQQYSLAGDNTKRSTNYSQNEVTELCGGLLWPRV